LPDVPQQVMVTVDQCGLVQEKIDAPSSYTGRAAAGTYGRRPGAGPTAECSGDVDDPTFAALEQYFNPQAIVEPTYTVGSYYANGLLTKALRIQVETDGRETVAGKC
jgi:hypothetical protein